MSIFTVTVKHLSGDRQSVSTRVRYTANEYDTRSEKTIVTEKAIKKLFGPRVWFAEEYSNAGYGQIFKSLPGQKRAVLVPLTGQNCSTSVTNMVQITVTGS